MRAVKIFSGLPGNVQERLQTWIALVDPTIEHIIQSGGIHPNGEQYLCITIICLVGEQ